MSAKPQKHKLRVLSDQQINDALKFQNDHSSWSFYSERELLETVISQRINFVITVFALFITAAATVRTDYHLRIVLCLGATLVFLLLLSIYRVHIRLDIVQKILYKAKEDHVFPLVQKEIIALGWRAMGKATTLLHLWIPLICILIMLFGIVASFNKWISVG